jgi:hypothetical protein
MAQHLAVPSELRHLIEKRLAKDRRGGLRRKPRDRRAENFGPLGTLKFAEDVEDVTLKDRRRKRERRQTQVRRLGVRRRGGAKSSRSA